MFARILMAVGLLAVVSALVSVRLRGDEAEQQVAPATVPQAVREAAQKAVTGLRIEEAEVEAELIFELEGVADGKEVEIELTSEGHVIRSEAEGDDDQEDGDADQSDESESDEERDEDEENELEISLSDVPSVVVDAAKKAIPGFDAKEAEVRPCLIYEIEGEADGIEYEIEVTAGGNVLEVEKEAVEN